MRAGLVIVGLGLVVSWLAGFADHATPWLTWMTLLFGLAALASALVTAPRAYYRATAGALGAALLGLWLAALSDRAHFWLTWWAFGLALVSLFFAAAGGAPLGRAVPPPGDGERSPELL